MPPILQAQVNFRGSRTTSNQGQHHSPAGDSSCPSETVDAGFKEAHIGTSSYVDDRSSLPEPPLNKGPTLATTGGGLYFFWQLGALRYLREHYDASRMQMTGASAGALVSTVAACNVDPTLAVESAYRIACEAGVWNKKLGLLGIWGSLLRTWLDEILPQDAHLACSGRLKLIVTDVLAAKQKYISDFPTRQDLIEANMCSIHVPFFLDYRPFACYKGRPMLDGSFTNFFMRRRKADLLNLDGQAYVLDYTQDRELAFSRLDFLKLRSYDAVLELVKQGAQHAARVDTKGEIKPFFGSIAR